MYPRSTRINRLHLLGRYTISLLFSTSHIPIQLLFPAVAILSLLSTKRRSVSLKHIHKQLTFAQTIQFHSCGHEHFWQSCFCGWEFRPVRHNWLTSSASFSSTSRLITIWVHIVFAYDGPSRCWFCILLVRLEWLVGNSQPWTSYDIQSHTHLVNQLSLCKPWSRHFWLFNGGGCCLIYTSSTDRPQAPSPAPASSIARLTHSATTGAFQTPCLSLLNPSTTIHGVRSNKNKRL